MGVTRQSGVRQRHLVAMRGSRNRGKERCPGTTRRSVPDGRDRLIHLSHDFREPLVHPFRDGGKHLARLNQDGGCLVHLRENGTNRQRRGGRGSATTATHLLERRTRGIKGIIAGRPNIGGGGDLHRPILASKERLVHPYRDGRKHLVHLSQDCRKRLTLLKQDIREHLARLKRDGGRLVHLQENGTNRRRRGGKGAATTASRLPESQTRGKKGTGAGRETVNAVEDSRVGQIFFFEWKKKLTRPIRDV